MTSRIGRGLSRVSSLSLKITNRKNNILKTVSIQSLDLNSPASETSAIPYSPYSDLPELTFASTSESRSLNTVRSSLLPPPRPTRKPRRIKDPFKATKPKRYLWNSAKTPHDPPLGTGIDPARWAEMSISAAELVQKYGKENVVFGATPQSQCADGDESFIPFGSFEDFGEESSEETDTEDEDVASPLHVSTSIPISSSPSPYKRSISQDQSFQSQSLSQELDFSLARNSRADSVTSFSKWPLPPTYDKFRPSKLSEP
jgi:hypothetical protein